MSATIGKEIHSADGFGLQGVGVWGGKCFAQYEQNATSQLKIFNIDGTMIQKSSRCRRWARVFGSRGNGIATRSFMGFSSFTGSTYGLPLRFEIGRDVAVAKWMRLRSIPRLMR